MKNVVIGIAAAHLFLSALYALPIEVRDHPYSGTWFEQRWPLFSSHYPLDQVLRVMVVCAGGRSVELSPKGVSPLASRPLTFRLRTASLHVPHFEYALEKGEQRTPQGFLTWLAGQQSLAYTLHAYIVLARRTCAQPETLKVESCPVNGSACVYVRIERNLFGYVP